MNVFLKNTVLFILCIYTNTAICGLERFPQVNLPTYSHIRKIHDFGIS